MSGMRTRDWTLLKPNVVALIGELLIADDDLADLVRLRAVCHPWRSSTEEVKRGADCLYPYNWIMLSYPKQTPTKPWRFYNTSTLTYFRFDLTPYLEGYTLFRAFDCVFLLKNNITQGIALLNPFMRSVTQLPSKIESKCANAPSQLADLINGSFNRLVDVHVTRSSTIELRFSHLERLIWTRPGDQTWVYDEFKLQISSNVLFYEDRIIAIDVEKGLMQINFANEIPQPQLEVVISMNSLPDLDDAQYLVDCGGDIILVSFMPEDAEEQHFWESFEVYTLDLIEKTYDRTTDLGDRSIFLGDDRTLSVCFKANSIYLCELYYGDTACYNLSSNKVKFSSSKPFLRPSKLAKKLITYCERTQ